MTKPNYKDLDHGSTVTKINNLAELKYISEWLKAKGKDTRIFVKKYPIFISTKDGGWTDLEDRALHYISFDEFLSKIGYKI